VSDGSNFGHTETRRGRPRTSSLVAVTFKLEPELLARVDREAARMCLARSDVLRQLLVRALDAATPPTPPTPPTHDRLEEIILEAVHALDAERRYGGLVPLPPLRERLAVLAPAANRAAVDEALIALERAFLVDLLVAQSTYSLGEAATALGIARPGRGLVFYVAPR
jgi:hypothetical protein